MSSLILARGFLASLTLSVHLREGYSTQFVSPSGILSHSKKWISKMAASRRLKNKHQNVELDILSPQNFLFQHIFSEKASNF